MGQVDISRIPGGIALVVDMGENSVDLIISGLKAKNYDIGEKILKPEMEKRGIKSLNKLIILNTDYNAIDDLLRFAVGYSVGNIYYSHKLQNSIDDQLLLLGEDSLNISFEPLLNTKLTDKNGYYPIKNGLCLTVDSTYLWIIDKIETDHFKMVHPGVDNRLILSSSWNLSYENFKKLKELGYTQIICSNIAHLSTVETGLDEMLTNSVIDLQRVGTHRLKISKK